MRRVVVVGNSGSGQTTFARKLAFALEVPHIELDSLWWRPGWTESKVEDFLERVAVAIAGDMWVVDGNYSRQRDLTWARADSVVWLDLAKSRVIWRVATRTVRRAVMREELWHDNREPLTNFTRWDPHQNIIRWAWTRHDVYRERYAGLMVDERWKDLAWYRLRSPSEMSGFLESVSHRELP